MASNSVLQCPFCGFTERDDYALMFHLETLHPEGESPFDDLAEFEGEDDYAECLEGDPRSRGQGSKTNQATSSGCQRLGVSPLSTTS
jgi:hypothetical protein